MSVSVRSCACVCVCVGGGVWQPEYLHTLILMPHHVGAQLSDLLRNGSIDRHQDNDKGKPSQECQTDLLMQQIQGECNLEWQAPKRMEAAMLQIGEEAESLLG